MKTKLLCVLLILMLIFSAVSCTYTPDAGKTPDVDNQTSNSELSTKLDILRSDKKLTQEQMLSQIKAENLIKNDGYKPEDNVTLMVALKGNSLVDDFNEEYYKTSEKVADYATSFSGSKRAKDIHDAQQALINKLYTRGLIDGVEYTYSAVMNGIAVNTQYGKIGAINGLNEVETVFLSDTFNLPKAVKSEGRSVSTVENAVDIDPETGIYNSSAVKDPNGNPYTGEHTSVAILDSGFDCSHTVFTSALAEDRVTDPMFKEEDIKAFFNEKKTEESHLKAFDFTKDLEFTDVYHNKKIPYAYDYADKDSDVFPYDSSHGTHVAGIIGGKDDVINGIAIDTQLVLMKVFPDLSAGGETEDIVAALEDSVLIGVDAINMSLGSSCGFVTEEDNANLNNVYSSIKKAGISLITAASNSFSASWGGAQGNTNMVTNPDSGTVGSPSTYDASLSVASIDGKKSRYLVANNSNVIFFDESNQINGKPYDFFKDLGIGKGQSKTYEYVTIPGIGADSNYRELGYTPASKPLKGKIALVRRGKNTFEEKAQIANSYGADGCIIYNNIDGQILMSMGKGKDYIPTISVSKDNGMKLAEHPTGKIEISDTNQAGPFMSDFSSWGPTPSLTLKPEITAHGGNIKSSVPGGGYEEMSGTSMATPNLCGIVILIRQYVKDKYGIWDEATGKGLKPKEINDLTNRLLMSTATIALNEEGNPYSPRKQGAGLASLGKAVNAEAYLTVEGSDRSKIELFDDPERTGVYNMKFNVVNITDKEISYDLSLVGMTETVSTFDKKHVAEKDQILGGKTVFSSPDGKISGNKITVPANGTVAVEAKYTLSEEDKKMITNLFPFGMYVEGYVKLNKSTNVTVDLNIPFLAFFGDWTEAPMFDKTFYEVESEAFDDAIDEDDKIKADYYATTPYGMYFYNYMIPLGKYIYEVDGQAKIPANKDKIAISNVYGAIDGISTVYAGLLRNAKTMDYTVTDKVSGDVVYSYTDYNARKAYSNGATPIPNFHFIRMSAFEQGLINNHQYEFKMLGKLDYGDGGLNTNVRNTFSFDFYMDDQAPIIRDAWYEKKYDKSLKKDRYFINLKVYDNHYVQSIQPLVFTSSSSYTFLAKEPIRVNGEKGKETDVRFEITSYLEDIEYDAIMQNGLCFSIDDYALNSNIFICQLPGTKGEFKFTKDGTMSGSELRILSGKQNQVIDLTKYLATKDSTIDQGRDYLKYLDWNSSNERVAKVHEGLVKCIAPGKAIITATEKLDGKKAAIILNIKEDGTVASVSANFARKEENNNGIIENFEDEKIKSIRFSYFETQFAFASAAQFSELGKKGDLRFISAKNQISLYPGESVKLFADVDPWYIEDKYEYTYHTSNESIVTVDQNGVIMALKKGPARITLKVKEKATGKESNLQASVKIEVKNPFIIENRMLINYKGLGGHVEIPDDEGILYIGPYAFCLYETDPSIKLPEDDYDKNKIPEENYTITSITIPEGVEDIQKYAFYNLKGLESVTIPDSVKFVREYAFHDNVKLNNVDLKNTMVIGAYAFHGCESLTNIKMDKIYAIGDNAFEGCKNLTGTLNADGKADYLDITKLRNTGKEAFKNCKSIKQVKMDKYTKLAPGMFSGSGLETLTLYERDIVPSNAFAFCENLKSVKFENDLVSVEEGAFGMCTSLSEVIFNGKVDVIGNKVFYGDTALVNFTMPDCSFKIGNMVFYDSGITNITFKKNTEIVDISAGTFKKAVNLKKFDATGSDFYTTGNEGKFLLNKSGKTVIFAAPSNDYKNLTLGTEYEKVGPGAFSGTNIVTLTITNPDIIIDSFAFSHCDDLAKVVLPESKNIVIGAHAFETTKNLNTFINLSSAKEIGEFAFALSGKLNAIEDENNYKANKIADGITIGTGAFFQSLIEKIELGKNVKVGTASFRDCKNLDEVIMPTEKGVTIEGLAFANDINLMKIDFSKVVGEIKDQAFYNCNNLKEVDLANIKVVGEFAFADCSGVILLNLPVVEEIKSGAFARNRNKGLAIEELVLPASLKRMGEGAFAGCERITELNFASDAEVASEQDLKDEKYITEIPVTAFAGCLSLKTVHLSRNITKIGDGAFAYCRSLKYIALGDDELSDDVNFDLSNIETIGKTAFACNEKEGFSGKVNAPKLKELGELAFANDELTAFNALNLEKIGKASFMGNAFEEFTFGTNIKDVEELAFNKCYYLKKFTFMDGDTKKEEGNINENVKIKGQALYVKMATGMWQLTSIPASAEIKELNVVGGTTRIDLYAGNENRHIEKVILPDGLMVIANYAFEKCTNLQEVEFKTTVAPALESNYKKGDELTENDPGYEILHKFFDIFGFEQGYHNFVDLVGKATPKPLKMILPANKELKGYDSPIYLAYFGPVENSERSQYVAMEEALLKFMKYAKGVSKIETVTLAHEELINDALTAYNALSQNGVTYGISQAEWDAMVNKVLSSKRDLIRVKISKSTQEVKDVQAIIDALPEKFSKGMIKDLEKATSLIEKLSLDDRAILDLEKYNKLMEEYESYNKNGGNDNTLVIVLSVVGAVVGAGVIALVIVLIILSKKKKAKLNEGIKVDESLEETSASNPEEREDGSDAQDKENN